MGRTYLSLRAHGNSHVYSEYPLSLHLSLLNRLQVTDVEAFFTDAIFMISALVDTMMG